MTTLLEMVVVLKQRGVREFECKKSDFERLKDALERLGIIIKVIETQSSSNGYVKLGFLEEALAEGLLP